MVTKENYRIKDVKTDLNLGWPHIRNQLQHCQENIH